MPERTPRVTVAISTFQRAGMLPDLIRALEGQTMPPEDFEVVIANDASTDDTREVLDALAAASSLRLLVLHLDRNQGQAVGRNAAWRAGRAPLVAFTDDDCIPTPTWLEHLIRPLESGAADIVQGRTQPRPDQLHRRGPWSRTLEVERENGVYQTCNIAYRRAALEAVGGFRTDVRMTAGEDTDLALTVKEAGFSSTYCDDALVHHEVTESSWVRHLRERPRWATLVLLVRRHPSARALAYRRYFYRPSHARFLALALALTVVAVVRWWVVPLAVGAAVVAYSVRTRSRPEPLRRRLLLLAQSLIVDGYEVAVFALASARYRCLFL